jgi:hypothetical protein
MCYHAKIDLGNFRREDGSGVGMLDLGAFRNRLYGLHHGGMALLDNITQLDTHRILV